MREVVGAIQRNEFGAFVVRFQCASKEPQSLDRVGSVAERDDCGDVLAFFVDFNDRVAISYPVGLDGVNLAVVAAFAQVRIDMRLGVFHGFEIRVFSKPRVSQDRHGSGEDHERESHREQSWNPNFGRMRFVRVAVRMVLRRMGFLFDVGGM